MKKVFIWGGCTSRDAVEYYPEFGLELQHYVARQSLISAFNPANANEFEIPSSFGRFQRRMLSGDITSSLKGHVRDNAPYIDLFVWDLMIERVGVTKVRSGGIITRHGVPRKDGLPRLGGSYDFGTADHLRVWEGNLNRFVRLLEQTELLDKTVINATPWATHDKHGNEFTIDTPLSAKWWNHHVEDYLALAQSRGIKVARLNPDMAIADPDHKWGPAYYHYIPETYKAQLETISALI